MSALYTKTTSAAAAGATESAVEALRQMKEIDDLIGSESDHGMFNSYLRSTEDLEALVRQHDQALQSLRDEFIQDHVNEADSICQLYNELNDCDKKIVGFEEEIVEFLRKLEESANDIVHMQTNTDVLVRSITHRRQVSNKIHEVYTVLQECDAFCEDIANKEVDRTYLSNLREVVHKLSFLSQNKAIQGSPVDNELRPKLTRAAQKAGDKLRRYLSRSISALAECRSVAELEQQQQVLEQTAQYAFRFLLLFNIPIARELTALYVKSMSGVFVKWFRALVAEMVEAAEVHAHPLEPVITAEQTTDMLSNRDAGAPRGNQAHPAPISFPARVLPRRERSVSQHMRGLADTQGARPNQVSIRSLQSATFEDEVKAVTSLRVKYGKLHVDEKRAAELSATNSFTWRFARALQSIGNVCTSECHFIGNFFCVAGNTEGSEDYNSSEKIARSVLASAISAVESAITEDVPLVSSREVVLASLRALEVVKQYLCTSLDPIPLLLLSGILEITKASLKGSLRTAIQNDKLVFNFLPDLKMTAFHQAPGEGTTMDQIADNRPFAVTLAPHPIMAEAAERLGQIEFLNVAPFRCETFQGATSGVYDPHVATYVCDSAQSLLSLVARLSQRHKSKLAQSLFAAVNVSFILSSWQSLRTRNEAVLGSLLPAASDEDKSKKLHAAVYVASENVLNPLDRQLTRCLQDVVEADSDAKGTFGYLFQFAAVLDASLGAKFFENPTKTEATLPDAVSEANTLVLATQFHDGWSQQLSKLRDSVKNVTKGIFSQMRPTPQNNLQKISDTFIYSLFYMFVQRVADANTKLSVFISTFYGGNRDFDVKAVSNVTFCNEAQRLLR
ncbi:hypothetical protein STCU_01154 [Strigomonas culicis]|uniref:Vps52 coiled-coil domain-containing protein n=1 Tax=Strigomonas culicis TaxID=28005 RepID=S9UWM6_9TRYP|nr:hypothetical protein STCU_01154 [Strigomonas culicis]|eukprot:EPY35292.1 hypothetical protein STCU_01154 [Strigomonas culicis]